MVGPEQHQWSWQWRGSECESHPNPEVLLSPDEIQIQRYRVQVYTVIGMETGKALSWGYNPQQLELIPITSAQKLRQRRAVGGRYTEGRRGAEPQRVCGSEKEDHSSVTA